MRNAFLPTFVLAAIVASLSAPVRAQDAAGQPSKTEEAASHLLRGNSEQAIADFTDVLKDTGLANDRRATMLNDRAVAYVRTGQTKLALDDFNKAVQLFPEYPTAYNNRGNLLLTLGQTGEAIKDFDRAVLLAPKFAAAYSNRASARLKSGQHADAISDFTKAIELLPASAPPLSGRGLAYLATGKPHAAIRDFSRAVTADARFATAYRNRAEARLKVAQTPEAIEDLSRALAFDTNNTEIYVVRGYAYLADNNAGSAIKDFSRALELDDKSVDGLQGRGLANGMIEAFDAAYADLNRAIELNPRSATAFAYRGYLYKQQNQIDIGQKDIDTALKLDAENARVLWARAELVEARGDTEAAVKDFRRVLALEPGWRLASDALTRLGSGADVSEDRPLKALGFQNWRVVVRGAQYFATNDDLPTLRVPLEMQGEGAPKLVAFDIQPPPHRAYGVLRYESGIIAGQSGAEITELAAILDLEQKKVIGIQPHRRGARVAGWTWEEDRVQVASIDGVTDEYQLRAVQEAATPIAGAVPRRQKRDSGTAWAPWDQPLAGGSGAASNRPSQKTAQKKQKPKSFFQLLFGN